MLDQKSANCANFSAPSESFESILENLKEANKGRQERLGELESLLRMIDASLENIKKASEAQQERLGKLEALLRLMDSSMGDNECRYISRLAIDLAKDAYDFHDTSIGLPLFGLKA
jgi:chromosome condensin MukBEF complex kleisin-like MukF subunit